MTRSEQLSASAQPMLLAVVRRFVDTTPAGFDEVKAAAMEGLAEAIARYQPEKLVPFPQYAKHRVRGSVLDYLRTLDPISRDSRHGVRRIERARRAIGQREMRDATSAEVAAELRWTPRKLGRVTLAGTPAESLDGLARAHLREPAVRPSVALEWRDVAQLLERAQQVLSPRYRRMMELYYRDELTMREIGEVFGVNESRISQMHKEALRKLRVELNGRGYHRSLHALPRAA